jgi:ribosomal protein S12 methylthiotransferase
MRKTKLYLTSLGCAKNRVDSEMMLGKLSNSGWVITSHPEEAETIIINTCSFIESAINESIDTILELAQHKKNGLCKKLIVAGCLPERYREKIMPALPEVDVFLGTGAFDKIIQAARDITTQPQCILPDPDSIAVQDMPSHRVLTTEHMAYLKIAEGCSRHCTYCIIPKLRGKLKSRSLESIVSEASFLVSSGVKELILVAQDTTSYGTDLEPEVFIGKLLERLANISENIWIRLLYANPESVNPAVIKTVASHTNICSYYDIPIQHASDSVLKKMGRRYTRKDLYRLFHTIKKTDPDAALRTTAMVGFPGETDADFNMLLQFIKDIRFSHLGTFLYSDSEDILSHKLDNHVAEEKAKERYDQLMSCQQDISLEINTQHMGNIYQVLVEEASDENTYKGRTYFQTPESDGITYIHPSKPHDLHAGQFAQIRIVNALEYDLIGDVA